MVLSQDAPDHTPHQQAPTDGGTCCDAEILPGGNGGEYKVGEEEDGTGLPGIEDGVLGEAPTEAQIGKGQQEQRCQTDEEDVVPARVSEGHGAQEVNPPHPPRPDRESTGLAVEQKAHEKMRQLMADCSRQHQQRQQPHGTAHLPDGPEGEDDGA